MLDLSRHFPGDHNPKMPWEEGGKKASEIAENTKRQVLFGVLPTIEAFQPPTLPLVKPQDSRESRFLVLPSDVPGCHSRPRKGTTMIRKN